MAAYEHPELYHAYIAMAQITDQKESERIAFKYMLDEYARRGDEKAINALHKYAVLESEADILPYYKSGIRDKSMHELGIGTMREMNSVFWGVFIPVWNCKAYTLREKINIWKSKFTFLPRTRLIDELLSTDFSAEVKGIRIPVYFLSGKYDLTVNINLSKQYLNILEAPIKGFYTFANSAHSPIFEEPEKFKEILEKDILPGKVNLADRIE